MGVVTGPQSARSRPPATPTAVAPPVTAEPAPKPFVAASRASSTPPATPARSLSSLDEDLAFPVPPQETSLDPARSRLRLAPTNQDLEIRELFDGAGSSPPAPKADVGSGSWSSVLSELDRDPQLMGEELAAEIAVMGIDGSALLPNARIDAITIALQSGDQAGAREVVRRLAPAAIRRLVRRLFSDQDMRFKAEAFVTQYGQVADELGRTDREGTTLKRLLGSELGRAYLLLDAAGGDRV